jgi:heat-inducible transcriptional repressor
MSDPLNHRARKILSAVVHEYLNTGEAVGSRTVTRRYGIDLSPATVRNVMSDLEEAGLLKQPHTSAGRVPTDQGLRFFVDSLLKVRSLSGKEKDELTQRYHLGSADLDTALRDATKVLSELSTHTVVLVTPRPEADVLQHVEFVRLREHQLLVVLVTKSGQVSNKIVTSSHGSPLAPDELERMNNYLNHVLGGLTLDGVVARVHAELQSERIQYSELEKKALELSAQALPGAGGQPELIIEGQSRLLESVGSSGDPAALDKMKALLRALEEKRHLADLLDETVRAPGIRVFIGAETHIDELADFTVVATGYGPSDEESGRALGTIGVIGPTRMNYNRVINLVDFTAQIVSGVIGKR